MESVHLNCPACGKEIIVPTELEVFSCVYCGAKHRMDAMPTPTVPADKADYAYAQTHLLDCIRNFHNAYKHFDRKQYAPFFQAHKESLRPVFEAMDRWVCAHPFQSQTIMADFAEAFLRQWEEYHQTHPKSQTRRAAERLFFSDKLTLAWYTVPAIRDLDLSISESFTSLLCERFNEKYPDNRFERTSFAEINSGFRKRWFLFGK